MKRFVTEYANFKIEKLWACREDNQEETDRKINRISTIVLDARLGLMTIEEAMKELAKL